jgi:carbon monoxide dehydrogenase subunit G
MDLTGSQSIAAPRAKVWEALNDPEVLRASIPGCQSLTKDGEDRFAAVAEIKIGPIGARFKGNVQLSEIDAPNGYVLSGQGNGGIAGNAKGRAVVTLSDHGAGTLLSYTVEADVGGRMAQLGGPVIDATAKRLADQFFTKFGAVVSSGVPVAATPSAAAMPVGVSPPTASASLPWGWLVTLGVALIAGYLLGTSGQSYGWVAGVILLTMVAAIAGFSAGRKR